LKQAQTELETAENAWRTKQPPAELDVAARKATSAGVHAEEIALTRRAARLRREEIRRRDDAVRSAEESTATANQRIEELRASWPRAAHTRTCRTRCAAANDQARDLRVENARLRDDLQSVRAEGDAAKINSPHGRSASAEEARTEAERREQERRAAEVTLRKNLGQFGAVRDTAKVSSSSFPIRSGPDARAKADAAAAAKLEPLAACWPAIRLSDPD